MNRKPIADLFCGSGGLSLGFQRSLGFERAVDKGDTTETRTAPSKLGVVAARRQVQQIKRLGAKLVTLVNGINQIWILDTGKPLFNPSTMVMEAIFWLQMQAASNEPYFFKAVILLYCLIWEATGANGGTLHRILLGTPGAEVLQMIRDLRLLYCHDLEQDKNGHEEKLKRCGHPFKRLINRRRPEHPSEWREAQIALYREVCAMLEAVRERIVLVPITVT